MSREKPGSFADFFPNAPSVLQQKRKQTSQDVGRSSQKPVQSTSNPKSHANAGGAYTQSSQTSVEISNEDKPGIASRDEDEANRGESGDLLNGVGSASSLASTNSSIFSTNPATMSSYPGVSTVHTLTPLTNADSSPPGKLRSPQHAKIPEEHTLSIHQTHLNAPTQIVQDVSKSMTPIHTPPETRLQARPGAGEVKGLKLIYDPDLDQSLRSAPRDKRRSAKASYREFGRQYEGPVPPDPRLAIPHYTLGKGAAGPKTKLRPAPFVIRPYARVPGITVGEEPSAIVVTGFDPFTPEKNLRAFFGGYGEIAELKNQTDPNTGSFLGICFIKYRDSRPIRKEKPVSAIEAAKKAQDSGTGERIGTRELKVELDKSGRRCRRYVELVVKRNQAEQDKLKALEAPKKPEPFPAAAPSSIGPPPDAPKGPSGRGVRPPEGPRVIAHPKPAAHALVEEEPILPQLKLDPYIFIAHCYVPVLGTTIPHLKKRMKNYRWKDVRLDRTGYFIIFDGRTSEARKEARRCYDECHLLALFTYTMNMELQEYGNPNYERSPSPERVRAMKRRKEEEERLKREEEEDIEFQKKERAENLDPVVAALESVRTELRDVIVNDIKKKIAAQVLYDYLDPERQAAKRRKLGVADPRSSETARPGFLSSGNYSPSIGTPDSRSHGFSGRPRKPLSAYDLNIQRARRLPKVLNAFQDERRKRLPAPKRQVRGLHRQMQGFYGDDEDSDDEERSAITRDTEELESRQLSRDVSMEVDDEGIRKAKRRRIDAGWGDESDEEILDESTSRRLLSHLINKEPEDMAEGELDQVLRTLPRSSTMWKRAKRALNFKKKLREAAEIFGGDSEPDSDHEQYPAPSVVEIRIDDEQAPEKPVDSTEAVPAKAPTKKPKAKRKTKKQLLEEQEALKAEAQAADDASRLASEEAKVEVESKEPIEETPHADVDLEFSTDVYPHRTVEDDPEITLDIDGWQHLLKDDADLNFLKQALAAESTADLGDVRLWAWKQKEIKTLNNGGKSGIVRAEPRIEGYYVANPSGSARTEGLKKILESEKSKYLPHRIRVQKAREEREARAKNEPSGAVETGKLATATKISSTSTSRSNRANNRRLANDINTQKQTLNAADGDAMRFNQLKKRKKLVKFDRSAIHNWGLYADENIAANDMIIEYVGEKVRQRVADLREQRYQIQGIGSSYLFRIDEDTVIDATKKGGIARFINHSCTPSCTAKIIKVDGTKRIVIYALRDISKNEELTYDYKFEREINSDDRIPCLCGSVGCKGFLN